jgi:molybdate transport system regulatory protein
MRSASMQPRLKVWIETPDGAVALSDWRIMLLERIAEDGSLVAAAKALQVPHRTAWQRIHEMETRLGVRLLHTTSGGAGGGRSELTPTALDLIERYKSVRQGLDALVQQRFTESFSSVGRLD